MSKGMFIAFEGPDGVGKTSTINGVAEELQRRGYKKEDVIVIQDPGTSKFGQALRPILKESKVPMTQMTQMMTFIACRIQMAQEIILPNLRAGKAVLCDRYTMSTIVYQVLAARQKWEPFEEIIKRTEVVIPSVYVVLSADYSVLRARRMAARWDDFFLPTELLCELVEAALSNKRASVSEALEKATAYFPEFDVCEDREAGAAELIDWVADNDRKAMRDFSKKPWMPQDQLEAMILSENRWTRVIGQWKAHLTGRATEAVDLVSNDRFENDRFQRRVAGCYEAALSLVQGDAPIIEEDTTSATIEQVIQNVTDTIMQLRNA